VWVCLNDQTTGLRAGFEDEGLKPQGDERRRGLSAPDRTGADNRSYRQRYQENSNVLKRNAWSFHDAGPFADRVFEFMYRELIKRTPFRENACFDESVVAMLSTGNAIL
jgi:hypothetical protein